MRPLIAAMLILTATVALAQKPAAERIAPYLTDTAVAVARIDLQTLDIETIKKDYKPFARMALQGGPLEEMVSRLNRLDEAGVREVFVVVDPQAIRGGGFYLVIPIPEGRTPPEVKRRNEGNSILWNDVWLWGPKRTLRSLQNDPHAAQRPGLAAAFRKVIRSSIQIVIAPTADQRRVLREMLPDLDDDYGHVSGKQLAASLKWAALGVQLEPKLKATLTIQSHGERAAAALEQVITSGIDKLTRRAEALPLAALLAEALVPERHGGQLTISTGEGLEIMSKALARPRELAREKASHSETVAHLKQLAIAMQNFQSTYASFPPSASYDDQGKPLLSWRVYLLPYLENGNLYRRFHLDEPWNSPHNKKFINMMPDVFKSPLTPTKPGLTVFQVPRGKGTLFAGKTGTSLSEFIGEAASTIMIVETTAEQAVPWTKPDDRQINPQKPLEGLVGQDKGFWAAFANGVVRFLASDMDREHIYDRLTLADEEVPTRTD